jgi:hypothetical protein
MKKYPVLGDSEDEEDEEGEEGSKEGSLAGIVLINTELGGRYLVEGHFITLPSLERRLAEIRVKFLDSNGKQLCYE